MEAEYQTYMLPDSVLGLQTEEEAAGEVPDKTCYPQRMSSGVT